MFVENKSDAHSAVSMPPSGNDLDALRSDTWFDIKTKDAGKRPAACVRRCGTRNQSVSVDLLLVLEPSLVHGTDKQQLKKSADFLLGGGGGVVIFNTGNTHFILVKK